jgi:uncharacterized protein (DUF4415 family)
VKASIYTPIDTAAADAEAANFATPEFGGLSIDEATFLRYVETAHRIMIEAICAAPAEAKTVSSATKRAISIRIDADIIAHFRDGGRGWQTRMNAVLRSYVEAQR